MNFFEYERCQICKGRGYGCTACLQFGFVAKQPLPIVQGPGPRRVEAALVDTFKDKPPLGAGQFRSSQSKRFAQYAPPQGRIQREDIEDDIS